MEGKFISNLHPNIPDIITENVEYKIFEDSMNPMKAVDWILSGKYVLVDEYYRNGLEILHSLKQILDMEIPKNTYQDRREYRKVFREFSQQLLLHVIDGQLNVDNAPEIGWLEKFYGDKEFLISFTDIQGLNGSWQWYTNGLELKELEITIHPYYGVYFPTRFEHNYLFEDWLDNYNGQKENALDLGIGSGILTFQMINNGFSKVTGSDINENAIIGIEEEAQRMQISNQINLVYGDLFENIKSKFELIVFNPPWIEIEYVPTTGIDQAMYYWTGLFKRFFNNVHNNMIDGGIIVLLFSNLSEKYNQQHPIKEELTQNKRFEVITYKTIEVQSGSKKTRRENTRKDEKVELWELKLK